eukprot:1161515-Pelagomonas_calceolata.AAC.2
MSHKLYITIDCTGIPRMYKHACHKCMAKLGIQKRAPAQTEAMSVPTLHSQAVKTGESPVTLFVQIAVHERTLRSTDLN